MTTSLTVPSPPQIRERWTGPLFFASGFAALLYQVAWQRALFTVFGTNIEAVTVVVTSFMLGLGLGSLLGGAWSRRTQQHLRVFALLELGVGVFGLFSLALFRTVGSFSAAWELWAVAGVSLLLVLFPTLMMGATLPVLVAYLVKRLENVGRSVGWLYFINMLGSALACFAAGYFLLGEMGLSGVVRLAAGINLLLAAATFAVSRRMPA